MPRALAAGARRERRDERTGLLNSRARARARARAREQGVYALLGARAVCTPRRWQGQAPRVEGDSDWFDWRPRRSSRPWHQVTRGRSARDVLPLREVLGVDRVRGLAEQLTAGYLSSIVLFPAARQIATWPVHLFVATHLVTMVLTMPSIYGYRLILPMYLFFASFSGLAGSQLWSWASSRWQGAARARMLSAHGKPR